MNQQIETLIDGRPFSWDVKGEFSWGSGGPLCQVENDPLLPVLGSQGYRVIDMPPGTAERIKRSARSLPYLEGLTELELYHAWVKSEADLTNGPGKLCTALGITGSMSAKSLQRKPLVIREGEPVPDDRVEVTTRIGITKCADWPLRWIVRGNRFVSKGKLSA